MSIVSSGTPSPAQSRSAFPFVRAVVPNPGSVKAWMPARSSPSRSNASTQTRSASALSSPPERPITTSRHRIASRRVASPVDWMARISSQRASRSACAFGTNGCGSTGRRRAPSVPSTPRPASTRTRRTSPTVRAALRNAKLAERSKSRKPTSTSATVSCGVRMKRRPSASSAPFSATRACPPKTRSVVDSPTPAPA